MQLVPFDNSDKLPAYLLAQGDKVPDINKEVVRAAIFPTMSIKGKVFTLTKDGQRKVLEKPDDDGEMQPVSSLGVIFLRANMKAKTFYEGGYDEANSAGQPPDCYSMDGVVPSPNARKPQGKQCQTCPRNVWGSRVNDQGEAKGRECSDNARIAISAPDKLEATLLRVPPASLKPLREALKLVSTRKVPYNAVVMKIGFDKESASPKLTFKPIGLVDDAGYKAINDLYDSEIVRAVVGLDDIGEDHGHAEPPASTETNNDELDAALAARDAAKAAAAAAAATPAPAPAPAASKPRATKPKAETAPPAEAPAPAPAPAPTAAVASNANDLMSELDDLLGAASDD